MTTTVPKAAPAAQAQAGNRAKKAKPLDRDERAELERLRAMVARNSHEGPSGIRTKVTNIAGPGLKKSCMRARDS